MSTHVAQPQLQELRLGSEGPEVRSFQQALNDRLRAHHDHPVDEDGELGPDTARNAAYAAWFLGALNSTVAETTAGTIGVGVQRMIADPTGRTDDQRERAKDRRGKSFLTLGERAYRVAAGLVGVMEQGGNNTGPMVDTIIRTVRGQVGEAWCGDFVAYCYLNAGAGIDRRWASVKGISDDPDLHGTNHPQRGDMVRYNFDHIGLFVKDLGNGEIETIEGNTGKSGAVSDSKTGGDGVYRKHRAKSLVTDYLRVER